MLHLCVQQSPIIPAKKSSRTSHIHHIFCNITYSNINICIIYDSHIVDPKQFTAVQTWKFTNCKVTYYAHHISLIYEDCRSYLTQKLLSLIKNNCKSGNESSRTLKCA